MGVQRCAQFTWTTEGDAVDSNTMDPNEDPNKEQGKGPEFARLLMETVARRT